MSEERRAVALLRGINVGGRNKIKMAELRELADELGLREAQTYIQSGNLLVVTAMGFDDVESALEQGITERFALTRPVIVRSANRWLSLEGENPFTQQNPKFVHYGASKLPPAAGAAEHLEAYARGGERIEVVGDGLWIEFASGVGKSKITPAVLDRCVGSTVTCRNLKTVRAIAALFEG